MPDTLQQFLKIHASTQGLNADEIEAIANVATLREYKAGETAVAQGNHSLAISLIISGHFSLSLSNSPNALVGYLGPNDQIGTLSIVQGLVEPLNVVAAEPSLVVEIPNEAAQELMSEHRLFARNLLSKASARMTQMAIDGGASDRSQRIAFIHVHSDTLVVSQQIQERLCCIGESLGRFVNEQSKPERGPLAACETLVLNGTDSERTIREQLAKWSKLDRVTFDINFENVGLRPEDLRGLLTFPERVFLLVTPENAPNVIGQLTDVLAEHSGWKDKLNLIWVLNDNHEVAPLMPELTGLVRRDFKVKVTSLQDNFFQRTPKPGVERIVHYLRGVKLGVALGGGAARGMSHLGVLRAMDEEGIVIDAIAGTSVGAMMGVSYCVGYSPDNGVERFTNALTPKGIFRWIAMGDAWYMLTKYRTHAWEGMLREHFFNWQLEQMLVPLTTIAADLIKAEEFVRSTGDGVLGILESINLGGIATPICRDGMALVDGGYLNNVPADTLVRDGANYVISVDVSSKVSHAWAGNTPDTKTEEMKAPRIGQVLARIREVAQQNLSRMGGSHANFSIAPDVSKVSFTDFKSTPQTAAIGYRAAQEAMPKLKAQLHQLDPQLFPFKEQQSDSAAPDPQPKELPRSNAA